MRDQRPGTKTSNSKDRAACAAGVNFVVTLYIANGTRSERRSFMASKQSWALARPSAQLPYFSDAQVGALYSGFG